MRWDKLNIGDGIEIQGFAVRINADGSMQCSCSGSTRTSDTKQSSSILNTEKKQKERLEKKREERKKLEEKAAKKRAEKKGTYGSRREYSEYLNHKYACLTPAKDSSVSINSNLLSKAASNPKTAKWLESTLSQMPDCIHKICENSAKNGARLVSLEISIDSEDCITTKCAGVFESDPGTEQSKKMLEEARARKKERKEEWEKLLEKTKKRKQSRRSRLNRRLWKAGSMI